MVHSNSFIGDVLDEGTQPCQPSAAASKAKSHPYC
jgi:hypothetical protein